MLNIFRRFRKELITERRLSRYLVYASGEIFLVVIGILIALQINTWNQHRENRNELMIMLRAFKIENQLNINDLRLKIEDTKHVRGALRGLLRNMGPNYELVDEKTIDSLFFEGLSITLYDPNKASFINLIGSGNLKYIKNDSLHKVLLEWNSKLDDLTNREAALFHTFKNIVLPHFYNKLSLVKIDRQFAAGYDDLPQSKFEFDNRKALSRLETENILEDHYYNMEKIQLRYEAFYENLETVNRLIEKELNH